MDHAGWYCRDDNTFRQLIGTQYIGAMAPPGGGRTQITQRYVRHFNLINFVPFSNESLKRIFTTILDWFLASNGFSADVLATSSPVVSATIAIYDTIAAKLLPTPTKSHYTFNLRDLAKVFQGLTASSPNLVNEKADLVRLVPRELACVSRPARGRRRPRVVHGRARHRGALALRPGLPHRDRAR